VLHRRSHGRDGGGLVPLAVPGGTRGSPWQIIFIGRSAGRLPRKGGGLACDRAPRLPALLRDRRGSDWRGCSAGRLRLLGDVLDSQLGVGPRGQAEERVATGALPCQSPAVLSDIEVLSASEVLAGARKPGRVVIADWGGDSAALDCAEILAGEGYKVTLAVGALVAGEMLHQYVRTSYLGRLHRADVRLAHHLDLRGASDGKVHFADIFSTELETSIEADVLVVSHGRVPEDALPNSLTQAGVPHGTARRLLLVARDRGGRAGGHASDTRAARGIGRRGGNPCHLRSGLALPTPNTCTGAEHELRYTSALCLPRRW
jgi:hypothetical protein